MTMYGSAPRGTHTAVKALVGLAVVVVLVAAVVVWRSATGDADPAAAPAAEPTPLSAAQSAAPAAPAPEVSSAPAEFSAGSWLVSLGGSGDYLTFDGDFAALSSGQRTVFTVVEGLADASCFSMRAPNGRYLRHYDFRLRFDKPDDADLYRKDATFCPLDGAAAGTVRLRSANYPDRVVHRRDDGLYLDKPADSDAFDADSSFAVERA